MNQWAEHAHYSFEWLGVKRGGVVKVYQSFCKYSRGGASYDVRSYPRPCTCTFRMLCRDHQDSDLVLTWLPQPQSRPIASGGYL